MATKLKNVADKATGTVGKTASKATGGGGSGELGDALRGLGQAVASRAAGSLTKRVSSVSGKLTDYADSGGGGGGLVEAVTGGKSGVKGKAAAGALRGGLSGIADKVKDKVKSVFGGGKGGKGGKGNKVKITNIVEDIDIGAPIDLVYDQWTRFTDFPKFMKKVENVEQISDEKLGWKAQVFWSHREWEATILEQVPNERIVWRSKGKKGHVDGAVTFHEVGPDLTTVVLVLAYHPQGLFERTGNIWRAQGRRARLELKHFRRHVMTEALLHPDDVKGWRGEIHDGEVVDEAESDESDEPRDESDEGTDQADDTTDDTEDADDADDAEDLDESDEPEETDEEDEATEEATDETGDDEQPAPRKRTRAGGKRRSAR